MTLADRLPGTRGAASTAGRAAAYLRANDAQTIARDLLTIARQYPLESLALAVFTGLLVGRLLFDSTPGRSG